MSRTFFSLSIACIYLTVNSCDKNIIHHTEPDPEIPVVAPDPEPSEPAKPIVLTTKQAEKLSGDNAFSWNLFKEVATSDDKNNAFISPLSLTMALGMLYNGASPDARSQMATALGMGDLSDTEINEYYQTLMQALLEVDPLTAMTIANSIWCRDGYPVKQTFFEINRLYYNAEVQTIDFNLPSTIDAINNWCADKTNDKITEIINGIPAEAVMYLINAVYFKSKWVYPFNKEETKEDAFTMEDGTLKSVAMMNQIAYFPYYADDMLQCIEMPYGNEAFSMTVLLPAKGKTVDDLVIYLDGDTWSDVLSNLQDRKVAVKFPRFKQEYELFLNAPVSNLGMKLIFQPGGNLNGIADDARLRVSSIKQKTFVEVNEEGTEAAAVTVIEIDVTSYHPPVLFEANRPFIYLIREKSTGAILFIGRMDEP